MVSLTEVELSDMHRAGLCGPHDLDVHGLTATGETQRYQPGQELGDALCAAVVITGTLADCCAGRGPDEATHRNAGVRTTHLIPMRATITARWAWCLHTEP